jgi:hypothetical protein
MKTRRIAILSCQKFPGEPWPQSKFRHLQKSPLVYGEEVDMELGRARRLPALGVIRAALGRGPWFREAPLNSDTLSLLPR